MRLQVNKTMTISINISEGFESLVRLLKSAILPIALHTGNISVTEAINASLLENEMQQNQWGSLEDYHALQRTSILRQAALGQLVMHA